MSLKICTSEFTDTQKEQLSSINHEALEELVCSFYRNYDTDIALKLEDEARNSLDDESLFYLPYAMYITIRFNHLEEDCIAHDAQNRCISVLNNQGQLSIAD
jgi:hypothetical protein